MQTHRSFIFNLLGNILPILVALVSVPVIGSHAGLERLGALGVVWALVGYFSFLDFGLSRVVTRRVAAAVGQGQLAHELTQLRGFFWWGMVPALLVIGLSFSALDALFDGYLPPGPMKRELFESWDWIALCVPVTLATNWFRGILEGVQRFARLNLLRTVFGSWNYVAPALVVIYVPTLEAMIAAIVLGRVLALVAHLLACVQVEPGVIVGAVPRGAGSVGLFLTEGGWMTVSNVISPIMVYFDRLLMAAMLPAKSVAWYVTAQEVMLRMLVIPGALSSVMFPQFAGASKHTADAASPAALYSSGVRAMEALMLPLCVLAAAGAYDGMRLWMGEAFAVNSHRVVELIAMGIFANSIAQLPFAWLQGTGHSKVIGQLQMAELPLYVLSLYICVGQWGILGAAGVWSLRVVLDCLMLFALAAQRGAHESSTIVLAGIILIAVIGIVTGPDLSSEWRVAVLVVSVLSTMTGAWYALLNSGDREAILRMVSSIQRRAS